MPHEWGPRGLQRAWRTGQTALHGAMQPPESFGLRVPTGSPGLAVILLETGGADSTGTGRRHATCPDLAHRRGAQSDAPAETPPRDPRLRGDAGVHGGPAVGLARSAPRSRDARSRPDRAAVETWRRAIECVSDAPPSLCPLPGGPAAPARGIAPWPRSPPIWASSSGPSGRGRPAGGSSNGTSPETPRPPGRLGRPGMPPSDPARRPRDPLQDVRGFWTRLRMRGSDPAMSPGPHEGTDDRRDAPSRVLHLLPPCRGRRLLRVRGEAGPGTCATSAYPPEYEHWIGPAVVRCRRASSLPNGSPLGSSPSGPGRRERERPSTAREAALPDASGSRR